MPHSHELLRQVSAHQEKALHRNRQLHLVVVRSGWSFNHQSRGPVRCAGELPRLQALPTPLFPHIGRKDAANDLQFSRVAFSPIFNDGPRLDAAGNHRNRWMPTEVSRHILVSGSSFLLPHPRISKYSDQGTRLEMNIKEELSSLLVDEVVAPSKCGTYKIWTNGRTYLVRSNSVAHSDFFQTNSCIATCIFIENTPLGTNDAATLRGACFYVMNIRNAEAVQSEGGATLEMVFFSPLQIALLKNDRRDLGDPDGSGLGFTACTRHHSCKFWVKLGGFPFSSFLASLP